MTNDLDDQYKSWERISAGAADSHAADWRRRTLESACDELEKIGAHGLARELAWIAGEEPPCWPIAKLTVKDGAVTASLYAPGLPDGDFDVWLEPVAPDEALCLECQGRVCSAGPRCEALTNPPSGRSFDKFLDSFTQELIESAPCCTHAWRVTQQGGMYADLKCSVCGETKRDSWE